MLFILFIIMLQLSPPISGHQRSGGHRRSQINQPLHLAKKQEGAIPAEQETSIIAPPPPPLPLPEEKVPAPRRVWKTTRANILWRAVDMDDLRAHPLYDRTPSHVLTHYLLLIFPYPSLSHFSLYNRYDALPEPSQVCATTPAMFAQFRQGSWQWDALHAGRLTTARAAACLGKPPTMQPRLLSISPHSLAPRLICHHHHHVIIIITIIPPPRGQGFYEPSASKTLGIPRSLCGHSKALHAWEFLLERAPTDGYCRYVNADFSLYGLGSSSNREQRKSKPAVWIPNHTNNNHTNSSNSDIKSNNDKNSNKSNNNSSSSGNSVGPPYVYRPLPQPPSLSQQHRYSTASAARMAWGSAQVPRPSPLTHIYINPQYRDRASIIIHPFMYPFPDPS